MNGRRRGLIALTAVLAMPPTLLEPGGSSAAGSPVTSRPGPVDHPRDDALVATEIRRRSALTSRRAEQAAALRRKRARAARALAAARAATAVAAAQAAQAAAVQAPRSATAPVVVPRDVWDRLAQCESGGNWADTEGMFEGGVQFLNSTWLAEGGGKYAQHAYQATREQQIEIAERTLASGGWGQWPACSAKLGLR